MFFEDLLHEAHAAVGELAWKRAYSRFADASGAGDLALSDIESFAVAAHLVGRDDESRELFARGYREALHQRDFPRAARFAFWIGHGLLFTATAGQSAAWFARARRALSEAPVDCAERGYLLVPEGIRQLGGAGRLGTDAAAQACETFSAACEVGVRFNDPSLLAMAGHGRGRSLIAMGRIEDGMAALDEVMVAVIGGEVSPLIVGELYCGVLEACHDVFDARRAREWTEAFRRWCDAQPDLVPYRGPCQVYRVELMRLGGEWQLALDEALRACEWLSQPESPEGPADAFYQLAELHRLRGDFSAAEDAYRKAVRFGRQPEPGLAMLWLARGQAEAARAAVARALDESRDNNTRRAELLAAYVEILLTVGDAALAQEAADELADFASSRGAPLLMASADRAQARVLLATGDAGSALVPLRRAWATWRQLVAPYEAARERVAIGIACRTLGDEESAALEFHAAREVFERLGATPDLAALDAVLARPEAPSPSDGLTAREIEVLRLVAAGLTNREIAASLIISEHTVARHVQNMLGKLGFGTRSRLAAFAVQRGMLPPGRGSS